MILKYRSEQHLIALLSLCLFTLLAGCANSEQQEVQDETTNENEEVTHNTLTEQEQEEGWQLLFDGESTDQWRGATREEFPERGWEINDDGILSVLGSDGSEEGWGGDIVTRDTYSDFELSLEFKITEGANSGIKYYVLEDTYQEGAALGLEYQILDDENHPDANQGIDGNRTVSSLYDLIPAVEDKPINPPGEWNRARIVAEDRRVEHWLNGEKVLEYDRDSEEFLELVSQSKYNEFEDFGQSEEGHILLQDHGNDVSFRNIKIRDLSGSDS